MGNSISYSQNKEGGGGEKTEDNIDSIASHYILTMDFDSLRKLYQKEYCDELLGLTSTIISRYYSDADIHKMFKRIKYGTKQDVAENHTLEKNELCNGIAKFYIKVAHLYAAIIMTINPEYVYIDEHGQRKTHSLSNKQSIPKGTHVEIIQTSLCNSRIDILSGDTSEDTHDITVKPNICSMDIYTSRQKRRKNKNSLDSIVGVQELEQLYYDDDYDYLTGNFKGMTKETAKLYHQDLKRFYSVFTGSETMPPHVKRFSDIPLKNYDKKYICGSNTTMLEKEYVGSHRDKLFVDYANNLKKMIANVNERQKHLLKVLDKLFETAKSHTTSSKQNISVHSDLTEDVLQDLISETRGNIVELYLDCETDFVEGLKLYEAIVESQILETSQKQIATLQSAMEKLYQPYKSQKHKTQ
jgi:hypothetical protein